MKKVVPILAIITGIYWVVMGFGYGFWVRRGPGGGFLPVVAGLMAVIFSVIVLWKERNEKSSSEFTWKALLPAGALLGLALCSYLVGMILSMALYLFLWLKYAEKYKNGSSLAISLGTTVVIYAIFIIWLKVPMPKGLLGLL